MSAYHIGCLRKFIVQFYKFEYMENEDVGTIRFLSTASIDWL